VHAAPHPQRRRAGALLAGLIGAAVAVPGTVAILTGHPYRSDIVTLELPGIAFTAFGVLVWLRRPRNGTGRLMVLVGITWYLGQLTASRSPILFAIGFVTFYLPLVAFAQFALALPTGRLTRHGERLNIAAQYVTTLLIQSLALLTDEPTRLDPGGDPRIAPAGWQQVSHLAIVVFTLVTVAQVARRWSAAGRPARREYLPVWLTLVSVGALGLAIAVATVAGLAPDRVRLMFAVYGAGILLVPAAVAAGLLRVGVARIRVADLLIGLDRETEPERLRALLAHALGDPTLELHVPRPGERVEPGADRAATEVVRDGTLLAVLVHDPALSQQRGLVDAVVAAARLALDNARLDADWAADRARARASRDRAVRAAAAQRRRIQRDLDERVQEKLLVVADLVRQPATRAAPPERLRAAAAQLGKIVHELRELTWGIYPPALAEQGLAAAVEALAERAPLPVTADIPARRWPEPVEQTAYFVISEALSNVYKHAGASHARVRVRARAGALAVEVVDDGRGGADRSRGTGLRGLDDRLTALHGVLRIHSEPGAGTRIVAEVPCAS
jgi:signal transduction histidine kinase